jgi:hypothetical protein
MSSRRVEVIPHPRPAAVHPQLMEAVARNKSGEAAVVKTMEELEALAGE